MRESGERRNGEQHTFLPPALWAQGQLFPEQVTTNQLAQNIVYAVGTVGALAILEGLLGRFARCRSAGA